VSTAGFPDSTVRESRARRARGHPPRGPRVPDRPDHHEPGGDLRKV